MAVRLVPGGFQSYDPIREIRRKFRGGPSAPPKPKPEPQPVSAKPIGPEPKPEVKPAPEPEEAKKELIERAAREPKPKAVEPLQDQFVKSEVKKPLAAKVALKRGKEFIRQKFAPPTTPTTVGFSEIFAGFRQAEKQKFEKPAGKVIVKGPTEKEFLVSPPTTAQPGKIPPRFGREITFGEQQKRIEQERAKEIAEVRKVAGVKAQTRFEKLQAEVGAGKLGAKKAQAQLDKELREINLETQKKAEQIYKKRPDVPRIFVRESKVEQATRVGAEAAFIETGIPAAVSAKKDPTKIDIKQIERGVSIEAAKTSRPTLRTATLVAGPLVGGGLRLARAGRAVEQVEVESAIAGALKGVKEAKRFELGEGRTVELFVAKGKGVNTAEAEIRQIVAAQKVEGRKLTEAFGKETVIVKGRRYFTQRPFVVAEQKEFIADVLPLPKAGKVFTGTSKAFVQPRARFVADVGKKKIKGRLETFKGPKTPVEIQRGVAIGRKLDKQTELTISGKLTKAELTQIRGKGVVLAKDVRLKFPGEVTTLTRIVRPKTEKVIEVFRPGPVVKTPLVKTFQTKPLPSLKAIAPPQVKVAKPTRVISKPLPKLKAEQTSTVSPGITTKQLESTFQKDIQRLSLVPLSRTALGLSSVAKTKQRQIARTKQQTKVSERQIARTKQLQKQIQKQVATPITPKIRTRITPTTGLGLGVIAPPIIPLIGFPKTPVVKLPKKRKKKRKEELFIVESFTAKQLKFEPKELKTPKDIERQLRLQARGGVIRAPKLKLK